ncbi:MmcQ/YjbR family DNA-binding protein [Pontibacter rugosus]
MHIEEFRDYCLAKPMVTEETPFGDDTLVYKVGGKIFALCSISDYSRGINLKCDPVKAIELRERYTQVKPGYHMSKKHWNTVLPEVGLSNELLQQWLDDSYTLVSSRLTKAQKQILGLKV